MWTGCQEKHTPKIKSAGRLWPAELKDLMLEIQLKEWGQVHKRDEAW